MPAHYFTLLAFGKLLLTYDPNWFCCQLFLVLPRHIVVISPLPQNYLTSAWNTLIPVSQRYLVKLNRLTAFQRSYFFNPCGTYISHISCLICLHVFLKCTVQNKNKSSSLGFNHADTSTSCFLYITLHLPKNEMKFTFFYKCLLLSLI